MSKEPIPFIDIYAASEPPDPAVARTKRRRKRSAVPFARLKRELLELYGPTMRAKSTRFGMRHALGVLAEIGVESTADLTVGTIARLIATRPPEMSPNTVLSILRTVRTVCNFAVLSGWLDVSPFAIRKLSSWVRPSPARGKSHLTRDEIRRILGVLADDAENRRGWAQWRARRLRALVALVAYTGIRLSEALWLQVEDVDLDERVINIVDRPRTHRTKTLRSAQPVTIPDALVGPLAEWLAHRFDSPPDFERSPSVYVFCNIRVPTPWTHGSKGWKPLERLQAVARRAGVDGATFQLLRRSCATHLEAHGAGPAMIQRILRHTSVQTGEKHYRKADVENMRRTMDGFDF